MVNSVQLALPYSKLSTCITLISNDITAGYRSRLQQAFGNEFIYLMTRREQDASGSQRCGLIAEHPRKDASSCHRIASAFHDTRFVATQDRAHGQKISFGYFRRLYR